MLRLRQLAPDEWARISIHEARGLVDHEEEHATQIAAIAQEGAAQRTA